MSLIPFLIVSTGWSRFELSVSGVDLGRVINQCIRGIAPIIVVAVANANKNSMCESFGVEVSRNCGLDTEKFAKVIFPKEILSLKFS